MKANKALKRLAKIEALISDVEERYSLDAVHTREAFRDARSAIARLKDAVSLQASSGTAKKAAPAPKNAAVKKAAAKSSLAKAAKKSAPITKGAQKANPVPVKKIPVAVKKTATAVQKLPTSVQKAPAPEQLPSATMQTATKPAARAPMPTPPRI